MPEHVCTCESCSRYNVKDPVTSFIVPGRIVGKKEFLSHRRLETIKQRLGDATDDGCTSSHRDPRSNNRTTPNTSEQPEQEPEKPRHLRIPAQRLQDRAVEQELQDLLDAMRSELRRRRMDYLSFPTRGLVFASLPDLNTSRSTARLEATGENLNLSPDAPINKKLIEYEGWLQHSLSSCTQSFAIHSAKYPSQDCLVDEITQAIQEVQATKVEEWTCQIAALKAQAPLPPTVVKRKCVIVEGGKFLDTRHLQQDPVVLCCFLGLAILHLVLNISIEHSGFVSSLFRTILDLCLSQTSQRPVEVHAIVSSIPLEVRTILGILNLRTHTLPFVCCPGCYKLYPDSSECPDLCTHRPAPDSEMCKAPLYSKRKNRGKAKRRPVRRFLYHDMKSWLADMLSRRDIEAHADRDVFSDCCNTSLERRDIWDGEVLRNFKGPDGELFIQPGSSDGRYVFSICMDGFNPFIMKEAGKKVSVSSIYMVLLNLPVDIRYQVENMFLVGIIPGPAEPSLEQINHILEPLVDDLLQFWDPGVFIKQTAHYTGGRLCFSALIPVVCDLPAARQMSGTASHSATQFCSFCKLPLHDIDNLDVDSWSIRTYEEHKKYASAWKAAQSSEERSKLYHRNGVRWSELLRLPYWDPTTFVVLDCMHSLLLGDLKRHCREIWGMDSRVDDDVYRMIPDRKKFSVTEDELQHGNRVLKHGTNKDVAALSFNVIRRLCRETKEIRYSRKRKEQLVEALLKHREKHGRLSPRDAEQTTVGLVASYTSSTDTSVNVSKPRRNELATGNELQDGRDKYTSATSFSKIQALRKGLMIALLLDLDSPSPNSEHELWAKNKQVLAGELWKMRQTGARPRADSDSYQPHPTNASSVYSGPSSRIQHDSGSGVLGPHFGASTTSCSLDGSDHWSDVFGNESSNDSESTHFSISDDTGDTTTRDPSQLTSAAFRGHEVDSEPSSFVEPQMGEALGPDVSRDADGDSGNARPTQARRKSSRKERVVLGRLTLAEVWLDMSKTTLPSWIGRAPPELGNGKHGKLSADQWRTACTVNLVVTLVRLWGLESPGERQHQMLVNFMDLVTACKLAMMRKSTPMRIKQFQVHMHRYLETTKKLYVDSALTPNHHLSLHLPRLFENFGPPHAWACFVFERCIRWLKFIKTSNKLGELEETMLTRFCMSQEVRILMQSADLPPVFHDLQAAFAKAFDAEARGTFWNDMWAFTSDFDLPIIKGATEIPLPTLVEEKLRDGLLDGVPAAHFPSVCLMEESFAYRGMKFSVETNSPGNSFVVFKYEHYQPWSAGSIQMILYLPIKGTTHGPFFVIKPYLPLNTADAQLDPYRKFIFAAGQLVYEDRGDPVVVSLDEVICHFAHTPFTPTNISRRCVHVLPLDRE